MYCIYEWTLRVVCLCVGDLVAEGKNGEVRNEREALATIKLCSAVCNITVDWVATVDVCWVVLSCCYWRCYSSLWMMLTFTFILSSFLWFGLLRHQRVALLAVRGDEEVS